ncbi:hypothetical protein DE146DRAFT_650956 [Phaeosphaeria sp. MPI-PUGE-AT-0046c]|nr:hypothetical protein DE146DRAFT_650956 [Phaeosphaeria sp. MPI-PUGE-AT-0046c]
MAIKTSSPNVPTWSTEHGGTVHFSGLPQYRLDMAPTTTPSIGSSQGFNGLPAIYSDTRQHGSDYSCSQQSSPGQSLGFYEGPSLMPCPSNNSLAHNAPVHGLPNEDHARASNDRQGVPTLRGGSSRSFSRKENDQAQSSPDSASDFHAQRRADDAILLEGKRNGLTYKDIRKKMHKKCAESTLRGRYRSLTKARQDRVRKPVWRQKDIELLTEFVTQDLNRIDASFHHSVSNDQRLAKVQWKKIADAIRSHGGSYHFGNSTCKRKWVELNPET